ncbi:winged helix DNA-binding domain-containing protein [Nocardioides sp.]|uniref:winged helix DNA-binding domain-containing protein n=1 Tax=Nocardioides sp. TaxID=35761 RepID=UPI003D0B993C
MHLGPRVLNRTLLHRQGLLARSDTDPISMVEHLVGLQAQETLPPYLSLNARLVDFDPGVVSRALGGRDLVRLLVMRGTIHLLTPADALTLRQFSQPCQDRERRSSQNVREAAHLDPSDIRRAVDAVLADGPLPVRVLGEALAQRFPGVAPAQLGQLARVDSPLVQVPPRGQWAASGGVIYQRVDTWLDAPLTEPDVPAIVRRYLRAFGPALAADVTTWSGVTRLGPVLAAMEDLVRHTDEQGRVLYDVADGEIVEEAPAPARLLGTYDNIWLSHRARDRVTDPAKRSHWMGPNGGAGMALFVDGWLEGLWRVTDGVPEVLAEFRRFSRSERRELDDELARVEALLAVRASRDA